MKTELRLYADVAFNGSGCMRRRSFLRAIPVAGTLGVGLSFVDRVSLQAEELRRRGMSCILLWMQGGPSQFETFSPDRSETGGGSKPIATNVSGIDISENLPETAKVMDEICVIRSMTSKEGSHPRATFLLHTGYIPNASVKHPTFGSVVAKELGDLESDLPSFVRIGNAGRGGAGAGLLGAQFAPLSMASAQRTPNNTSPTTSTPRYERRLRLLDQLETDFGNTDGKSVVQEHQQLYAKASRMVLSPQIDTFDISKEPAKIREAYGEGEFAAGCLLARRLVQAGVPFIEVGLGNWDTHQDNAERSKALCGQMDRPYAELLRDLKRHGLLDNTLVIWMGEFGRTPKINPRGGRDHYPKAFNVTLAGGGIRGGQIIGETEQRGAEVKERPVTVPDLFQTFCHSLRIDSNRENVSGIGRPIKIVEEGQPVLEAFS